MAQITLLHWNIYQFSNNKLRNGNGAALINYIAQVISQSQANIVALLELKNSAVNNIMARLIPAINLAKDQGPPAENRWRFIGINSQKNNEAYIVLYQLGNDFVPLNAAFTTNHINGLTDNRLSLFGVPEGQLPFNSSLTARGGRKPYYVVFRTTDGSPARNFSVVLYHTMFGVHSPAGVRNVGLLAQSRAILDQGVTLEMAASLTCGDFNVDFNPLDPGPYHNLLVTLPSKQSTNEKTSLVNFTPPDGFPDSAQYRKNAYDNIFRYNRAKPPDTVGGTVVDLIKESTTSPPGTAFMVDEARPFKTGPILDGELIQHIPPQGFEDAWHLVRHAISDHLPVYVNYTI